MDQNSERIIAATLTAAIIRNDQYHDRNDATREAVRVYRSMSRRLRRVHDDDERTELAGVTAIDYLHEDPLSPTGRARASSIFLLNDSQ